jgi:aminopeptidase N
MSALPLAAVAAVLLIAACSPPPSSGRAPRPAAGAAAPSAAELLEPGVSRALARHRAATIGDLAYELRLDVSDSARAPGRVRIHFSRAAGAGDVILDFRGSALGPVVANGAQVDVRWEQDHIVVAERHLRPGRNVLELDFVSAIAAACAASTRP